MKKIILFIILLFPIFVRAYSIDLYNIDTDTEYVAPTTELQKALCKMVEQVLGTSPMGITDDFFSLGGNSIAVMSFLSEFDDPRLSSSLLYRYPSPGALAVYCEKESINGLSGRTDRISYIREQAQKQRERYDTSESFPAFYASSQGTEDNMIRNVLWNPEISFTLREAPDPVRLQTAVDRAVRSCPYVGLSIEKKEGLLYFKKNALPLLVFTKEKNDSLRVFGSDEENRHYARVTLSGRKVIFSISHAITDGYGFNCFIQAVLDYYFGKEETRYKGADSPDYAADLMEFPLPLSGKQALPDPVPESHFVIPEIQNMQRITPRMFRASIPVSVMNAFMKHCRVGAQTAVSYLLALTVMRVHPENRLPISIRGPVNTRRIFGVPDSFQNASVPHVYLCADPEALSGTDHTCLLSEMQESFERQLSFENLANETNRMSEALRFGDPEEFARTVKAYGMKTGLLANYMGEIISDDLNGCIDETAVRLPAPFPIAVYAFNMGEQTHFEMVLTFPGDAYAEAFKNLLEEIKDGDYHD